MIPETPLLNHRDILTWGPFLDVESPEAIGRAIYDLQVFLERAFDLDFHDTASTVAMARDMLLSWARRAMETDWRSDAALLDEGNRILRRLRLRHMESKGFSTATLDLRSETIDDIDKEMAKQQAVRQRIVHLLCLIFSPFF
jgi:hypothetical protein